jgi:choloylglycine hydrolase
MKILAKVALVLTATSTIVNACGDFFINKGGFHVEARSMEFAMNTSNGVHVNFIGQKQTSNILINLDNIPKEQILSWTYENGFISRGNNWINGWSLDGLNNKGVSVSFLYAPGITKYPEYNKEDKRKVLGYMEVAQYVLSTATSTSDAIRKLKKLQIVNSGFEMFPGEYFKGIPLHLSIRDKRGNSAVVEWIDGETVIHENAGNVMTNSPSYPQQLEHAAKYSSLKITNTKMNKEFEDRVIDYDKIYNMPGARSDQTALLGLPADFTPPSRFVRATVLLDNMMTPTNSTQARAQATDILGAVATIGIDKNDLSLWYTIKDLDNLVVYYKELYYFQSNDVLYPHDPAFGYSKYDLKDIDFRQIPVGFAKEYKALSVTEAKKLTIKDMP